MSSLWLTTEQYFLTKLALVFWVILAHSFMIIIFVFLYIFLCQYSWKWPKSTSPQSHVPEKCSRLSLGSSDQRTDFQNSSPCFTCSNFSLVFSQVWKKPVQQPSSLQTSGDSHWCPAPFFLSWVVKILQFWSCIDVFLTEIVWAKREHLLSSNFLADFFTFWHHFVRRI